MRVYFSGIGGVGLGPLAEISLGAGHQICGSDREAGLMTRELEARGINVSFDQSGEFLRQEHAVRPIDWLVYTAALPADHPELIAAKKLGIKTSKRDEFLAELIQGKNLKLIAIAGTHGKTTTTGMMVWVMQKLGIPVSYSVGSTMSFAPSGAFDPASQFFVYECDEFDRNFLHFQPWLSLITSVDYDHPDTYPTEVDYLAAFRQFGEQSAHIITWNDFTQLFEPGRATFLDETNPALTLVGKHNRRNGSLVLAALEQIRVQLPEIANLKLQDILTVINSFPGTERRFEKLTDNLYSDYGHHPVEIAATLQMARELSDRVVLVYQPHQNVRQHEIRELYTDEAFQDATEIYWLPTYLTREDPTLPILSAAELTAMLRQDNLHLVEFDDKLWQRITAARQNGKLVLCMGAGTIDGWVRDRLARLSAIRA